MYALEVNLGFLSSVTPVYFLFLVCASSVLPGDGAAVTDRGDQLIGRGMEINTMGTGASKDCLLIITKSSAGVQGIAVQLKKTFWGWVSVDVENKTVTQFPAQQSHLCRCVDALQLHKYKVVGNARLALDAVGLSSTVKLRERWT